MIFFKSGAIAYLDIGSLNMSYDKNNIAMMQGSACKVFSAITKIVLNKGINEK